MGNPRLAEAAGASGTGERMAHHERVLCIAGPTASGKSAAALALAERLRGQQAVELISVDSALVYRGMDIGTAKPTAAEQTALPHHLIDILEPTASYSAAAFVRDATRLIGEIRARGAMPVLVGGTMLYFKALFDGLDEIPGATPQVRAALDAQARELGWPALHAQLAQVDPVTAARLAPNDAQRIQRALEVWHASGRPLSSFHTRAQREPEGPRTRWALLSLEPDDRAWLHQRIARRFDDMLTAGFVDEVRALRARGDLDPSLPSMRCVGYRQIWEALDDGSPGALKAARESGIAATRQLAKRQLTWLRSMPWRERVPCDAPDTMRRVMDWVDSRR